MNGARLEAEFFALLHDAEAARNRNRNHLGVEAACGRIEGFLERALEQWGLDRWAFTVSMRPALLPWTGLPFPENWPWMRKRVWFDRGEIDREPCFDPLCEPLFWDRPCEHQRRLLPAISSTEVIS